MEVQGHIQRFVMLCAVIAAITIPSVVSSGVLRADVPETAALTQTARSSHERFVVYEPRVASDEQRQEDGQTSHRFDAPTFEWVPSGSSLAEQRAEGAADTEGMSIMRRSRPAGLTVEAPFSGGGSASTSAVAWSSGSVQNLTPRVTNQPVWISAPSIDLDARVVGAGVDARSGEMLIPTERNTAGWYRHGSTPTEPGTTVIAGHLDDQVGLSVFGRLSRLEEGDRVELVTSDGARVRYTVTSKARYAADGIPSDEIFRRDGPSTLVLITCAGGFDWSAMRYRETLIIYAEPA